MASDHIHIVSTASDLGADVNRLVDMLTQVVTNGATIEKVMKRVSKGNVWTSLAAALGVTVEQAEAVQGLLTAANNVLKDNDISELTDRCG